MRQRSQKAEQIILYPTSAMGSCSSHGGEVEISEQPHAPMWVVSVRHVLDMKGSFHPHQVLKAEGRLIEWSSTMFTIFVSHQWLSYEHHRTSRS